MIQIHTGGLQTVNPCLSGVSRPAANVYRLTARWSPITLCIIQYNVYTIVMLYPSLLAVGGVTRDMRACIVRQDYTGAHFHALGWTTPQKLFILRHLRRGRCLIFSLTRQILYCSFLWNFFILYFMHKIQRHLCVVFIIYWFLLKRKAYFY